MANVKGLVLLVIQAADIVQLAIVIPQDNLNLVRLVVNQDSLLPALKPHVVAAP
jgi:hypothetical protein